MRLVASTCRREAERILLIFPFLQQKKKKRKVKRCDHEAQVTRIQEERQRMQSTLDRNYSANVRSPS